HVIRLFSSFVIVFFFQAEDGIRYRNVTGVQTCALPISRCRRGGTGDVPHPRRATSPVPPRRHRAWHQPLRVRTANATPRTTPDRSEERRVGKEGSAQNGGNTQKNTRQTDEGERHEHRRA